MLFSGEEALKMSNVLSGGEKVRCMLSRMMMQRANVVLLDEPTNHIDLNTIQWLESYLKNVDVPLVCVSHDREFLDQICNKIVEVERGVATTYKGNYSDYRREKETKAMQTYVTWEKWNKEVSRQRELIQRLAGGGQSGRATAAQAQALQAAWERAPRAPPPAPQVAAAVGGAPVPPSPRRSCSPPLSSPPASNPPPWPRSLSGQPP